jgi:hypothetical protein
MKKEKLKKYEEFADEFEQLCEKYACEDFNAKELLSVCYDVIQNYSN